jgi:hypothetical protein
MAILAMATLEPEALEQIRLNPGEQVLNSWARRENQYTRPSYLVLTSQRVVHLHARGYFRSWKLNFSVLLAKIDEPTVERVRLWKVVNVGGQRFTLGGDSQEARDAIARARARAQSPSGHGPPVGPGWESRLPPRP